MERTTSQYTHRETSVYRAPCGCNKNKATPHLNGICQWCKKGAFQQEVSSENVTKLDAKGQPLPAQEKKHRHGEATCDC